TCALPIYRFYLLLLFFRKFYFPEYGKAFQGVGFSLYSSAFLSDNFSFFSYWGFFFYFFFWGHFFSFSSCRGLFFYFWSRFLCRFLRLVCLCRGYFSSRWFFNICLYLFFRHRRGFNFFFNNRFFFLDGRWLFYNRLFCLFSFKIYLAHHFYSL